MRAFQTCQYPVADSPLSHCGQPTMRGSYCDRHWRLCYRPPTSTELRVIGRMPKPAARPASAKRVTPGKPPSSIAKAAAGPAPLTERAIQTRAAPAASPKPGPKPRGLGVGRRMEELLREGKSTADVLAAIHAEFPLSRASAADVGIIRRRAGLSAKARADRARRTSPEK